MLFTITSPHNLVKSSLKKIAVEVLLTWREFTEYFRSLFQGWATKKNQGKT